jgi:hypothetical protein
MSYTPWLTDQAANAALDTILIAPMYLSLHTLWPGNTGAGEVSGGTGPYARQLIGFSAAASRIKPSSDTEQFPGMPDLTATPVVAIGLWRHLTSTTTTNFIGRSWLTGGRFYATVFASTDTFTAPAHGLVNGDRVARHPAGAGTLPGGATTEGTLYHVISASTDTFQISTTQGGSAVNLTSNGNFAVVKVTPKLVEAGSTFVIALTDLKAYL